MLRISQSKITKAEDCFAQYYFQEIEGIEATDIIWPGTMFGYICHAILEDSVKLKSQGENDRNLVKGAQGLFTSYWDRVYAEQTAKERNAVFKKSRDFVFKEFLEVGEILAPQFLSMVLMELRKFKWVKLHPEIVYESPWSDMYSMKGVLDLLVELENGRVIFDYKTTKDVTKFKNKKFATDVQSIMYDHMVGGAESFHYLVQHSQSNERFVEPYYGKENRLPYLRELISKMEKKVLDGKDGKVEYSPEIRKCGFCKFNKVCPKSANRK